MGIGQNKNTSGILIYIKKEKNFVSVYRRLVIQIIITTKDTNFRKLQKSIPFERIISYIVINPMKQKNQDDILGIFSRAFVTLAVSPEITHEELFALLTKQFAPKKHYCKIKILFTQPRSLIKNETSYLPKQATTAAFILFIGKNIFVWRLGVSSSKPVRIATHSVILHL